jgi:vancomycin permeability regulator SanA
MKSVLLILLGCNITSLLMDRITTAINFIENNHHNFNKITWYLSGGIKFDGDLSEASIMKNELEKTIENKYIDYHYILDEQSKNTVENLFKASNYLNTSQVYYDDIFIITSKFHYKRAKLMLTYIDQSRNYSWILGDMQQSDSLYWESVHIRNVLNDINKFTPLKI